MKIALDYGHGGILNGKYTTAGKRYTFLPERLTVYEGVINREVAWRLANKLIAASHQVYDVVENRWMDAFTTMSHLCQADTSLSARVSRSNQIKPDLYISLHANAVGNSDSGSSLSANGFSIYTSPGNTRSDKFAEAIYSSAISLPLKIRKDLKDGDSDLEEAFYVLKETDAPAILIEMGFFTNMSDALFLMSLGGQEQLAQTILNGINK